MEVVIVNLRKKLSSRKLWAAIAGLVSGMAMVFGLDDNTISTISGAVTSVASVITYIIAEAQIDKSHIKDSDNATDR
jgi:phage shock protein PspC (stress-responsive transcriptional regulator)